MEHKPLIGITCNYSEEDEIGILTYMGVARQKWQFLADSYIDCVERAGGVPVIIPVCGQFATVRALLERLDGVIISGGNDISPEYYGEQATKECGPLSAARDAQDIAIASYLLEHGRLPMLGICRGIQVLNVAAGGTLHQDLRVAGYRNHAYDDSPMNRPVHSVYLEEGSRLRGIFGCAELPVNSYHHSAVSRLAKRFTASGVSDDGVLEAMELPGHPFCLAVQWHPEMMFDDGREQALIRALVQACEKGAAEKERSFYGTYKEERI